MRIPLESFANRPRLLSAIGVGAAVFAGLALATDLRLSTQAIFAWDTGCLVFIAATLILLGREPPAAIRVRAARQDEGRGMILALVTLATAASLAAVAIELSLARQDDAWDRAWRVALSVGTVALSWLVAQLIYALHYAHEYYSAADDAAADGEPDAVRGGLAFPGGEDPDYWDFLHFAVVIGVAAQTADIAFTSKRLRRVGTVHSAFAFVFNTVVLALTINLAAGLF